MPITKGKTTKGVQVEATEVYMRLMDNYAKDRVEDAYNDLLLLERNLREFTAVVDFGNDDYNHDMEFYVNARERVRSAMDQFDACTVSRVRITIGNLVDASNEFKDARRQWLNTIADVATRIYTRYAF